ncbi:MAG: NUDIX domain-containing protein [Candidatus Moranbacteria bacterium]|nr:NUDIX domain-containing protein [Candidatus Moranbacteria bacterium]
MKKRGCGIIFYNPEKTAVLLFRRDDKDFIPFPNMLDLLGGHIDEGEDPVAAVEREIAEELLDLRTGKPFLLQGHEHFHIYEDERDCEQHIFTCEVNFDIPDVNLLEGQELIWLTKKEIENGTKLAFGFEEIIKKFFIETTL